jgi:hypothetical protein
MPKSASPVRLQQTLMENARLAGARHQRSAAEQIEYWAALGRQVASVLDPDTLLDVASGLARLKVEAVTAPPADPEEIFGAIESERQSGRLSAKVSTAARRYQASSTAPGLLEEIDQEGRRRLGRFENGTFVPVPGEGLSQR